MLHFKIKKEIKIGILAVASLFLLIWGLNYLKGKDIFSKQTTFYAIYDDVSGLIESNPVSVSGVTIGQVNKIRFLPDGSGRILVENIVGQQIKIPKNSVSKLTGASLTGSREIIIVLGDSNEYIQNGDTLASVIQASIQEEVSQFVVPIQQRAEELFNQVDSVLVIFQTVFNKQTRNNIAGSFDNIHQTLYNLENATSKINISLEQESHRISNIFQNIESISQNIKNNNEEISNAIQNFSNISDSIAASNLKQTLLKTENSVDNLNQILEKITEGKGSIGLLVNDEELYNNLESSSKELELLLKDIRENPSRYFRISVFGR